MSNALEGRGRGMIFDNSHYRHVHICDRRLLGLHLKCKNAALFWQKVADGKQNCIIDNRIEDGNDTVNTMKHNTVEIGFDCIAFAMRYVCALLCCAL